MTLTSSNSLTVDLPFEKLKTGHFDVKIDEVPFSLGYANSPNLLMSHTRQMGSDIAVQASKTLIKDDAGPLRDKEHDRHMHEVQKDSNMPNLRHSDRGMSCNLVLSLSPPCSSTNTPSYDKNHKFSCKLGNASALCRGDDMLPYVQLHVVDDRTCTRHLSNISEWELEDEKNKICETRNFSKYTRTIENDLVHLEGHAVTGEVQINFLDLRNPVTMSNMDGDKISRKNLTQISCSIPDQPFIEEPPVKTLGEVDGSQKCTSSPEKVLMGSAVNREVSHPLKQQNRYDNDHKLTSKVQKFKKISNGNVHIKKPPLDSTSPSLEVSFSNSRFARLLKLSTLILGVIERKWMLELNVQLAIYD